MEVQARLGAAYDLVRAGRHEEALREFQWLHENALQECRSWAGVRLSYSLDAWARLGKVYPPARAALEAVCARDTALLLAGRGSRDLFLDVNAIQWVLGRQERTHALFVELERVDPELAQACAGVALTAIVATRDYALAERLLPDPERSLRRRAALLNADFAGRRSRRFIRAPIVASDIRLYVDPVREVLTVLEGRGRWQEAARLRKLAADLIPATTIRRTVRAALLPGARPWEERGRRPRRKARIS